MCLNTVTYEGKIPAELVSTYGISSYNEDGSLKEVLHPTFKELGEHNTTKFGRVRELDVEGVNYYIIELEVSWKEGEVSSLINLGKDLSYPVNTLMTNSEAVKFIRDNESISI